MTANDKCPKCGLPARSRHAEQRRTWFDCSTVVTDNGIVFHEGRDCMERQRDAGLARIAELEAVVDAFREASRDGRMDAFTHDAIREAASTPTDKPPCQTCGGTGVVLYGDDHRALGEPQPKTRFRRRISQLYGTDEYDCPHCTKDTDQ